MKIRGNASELISVYNALNGMLLHRPALYQYPVYNNFCRYQLQEICRRLSAKAHDIFILHIPGKLASVKLTPADCMALHATLNITIGDIQEPYAKNVLYNLYLEIDRHYR